MHLFYYSFSLVNFWITQQLILCSVVNENNIIFLYGPYKSSLFVVPEGLAEGAVGTSKANVH